MVRGVCRCAYLFIRFSSFDRGRKREGGVRGGGGGEDGDPDVDGGDAEVRVEVGDECKVNGGGVVGCLERAAGVEVAEGAAGDRRADERALGVLDGGAEGTGAVCELVGGEAGLQLRDC